MATPTTDMSDALIIISNAGLGHGDTALSRKMIGTYLRTLAEMQMKPGAIAFYTAGVQLVTDESPCLAELRVLVDDGVRLLVCRTCLEFYGMVERLAVGEVGNMAQIVELQAGARKVITV